MKPFSFFCFVVLILSASCGKKAIEMTEVRNDAGILIEKYERRTADGAKHGLYQKFMEDGTLFIQAQYENDTLHGKHTFFFPTGQAQSFETYERGQMHGAYQKYFEDGKVQSEGQYENGVMTGKWKKFYANGQVEEIVQFVNNDEQGPFEEFYENGKMKARGVYKKGPDTEDGLLEEFDENGELVKKKECESGRCKTIWEKELSE